MTGFDFSLRKLKRLRTEQIKRDTEKTIKTLTQDKTENFWIFAEFFPTNSQIEIRSFLTEFWRLFIRPERRLAIWLKFSSRSV